MTTTDECPASGKLTTRPIRTATVSGLKRRMSRCAWCGREVRVSVKSKLRPHRVESSRRVTA
jgi:hypothetical protein